MSWLEFKIIAWPIENGVDAQMVGCPDEIVVKLGIDVAFACLDLAGALGHGFALVNMQRNLGRGGLNKDCIVFHEIPSGFKNERIGLE